MITALLMVAITSGLVQSAATDLTHTPWQLVNFTGTDGTIVTPDDKSKYTITFEPGGGVIARIDLQPRPRYVEVFRREPADVRSDGDDPRTVPNWLPP
jgi:hypothetical protein